MIPSRLALLLFATLLAAAARARAGRLPKRGDGGLPPRQHQHHRARPGAVADERRRGPTQRHPAHPRRASRAIPASRWSTPRDSAAIPIRDVDAAHAATSARRTATRRYLFWTFATGAATRHRSPVGDRVARVAARMVALLRRQSAHARSTAPSSRSRSSGRTSVDPGGMTTVTRPRCWSSPRTSHDYNSGCPRASPGWNACHLRSAIDAATSRSTTGSCRPPRARGIQRRTVERDRR